MPTVAPPVAAYVPAVRTGNYVYTSGQLPMVDGALAGHRQGRRRGHAGAGRSRSSAQACALNALAAVEALIGDLDKVGRVVKVIGFVASAPGLHRPAAGRQRRQRAAARGVRRRGPARPQRRRRRRAAARRPGRGRADRRGRRLSREKAVREPAAVRSGFPSAAEAARAVIEGNVAGHAA